MKERGRKARHWAAITPVQLYMLKFRLNRLLINPFLPKRVISEIAKMYGGAARGSRAIIFKVFLDHKGPRVVR
jgi:hypothetical protein